MPGVVACRISQKAKYVPCQDYAHFSSPSYTAVVNLVVVQTSIHQLNGLLNANSRALLFGHTKTRFIIGSACRTVCEAGSENIRPQ